jgi:hypothetical protein
MMPSATEEIENAKGGALILLEELLERLGVDTGRGNIAAQAVHQQHG